MIDKQPLPASPGQYFTTQTCGKCGGSNVFYDLGDKCTLCLQREVQLVLNAWGTNADYPCAVIPTDPSLAIDQGVNWTLNRHATLCSRGPHLKAAHVRTGRCIICTGDSKDPARLQAFKDLKWSYVPTWPCGKCNGKERHTKSNKCVNCSPAAIPRKSAERELMDRNPEAILSPAAAVLGGLKVYRTGEPCKRGHKSWRYIKGNACIDCKNHVPDVGSDAPAIEESSPELEWMSKFKRSTLSRREAINFGLTKYKTGRPCKYGHISFRRVKGQACIDCQKCIKRENWEDPSEKIMREEPNKFISRQDAAVQGLEVFRDGDMPVCDHAGWKYLSSSRCVDCVKDGL